jgi:hypothetical protein
MPTRSRDHDTDPDGVPVTHDAATIARCQTCGGQAIKGGPIVPDEEMVRRRWSVCCFGDGWSWCHVARRFQQAAP